MKQFKILYAFLRLIRYPNLIIIAITQYFIRWYIIKPLLAVSGYKLQMGHLNFALLVLSTLCIAAGGYIINDYFDRKTDLINRPGRVIVGRLIQRRYAMFFHVLFTALGVILGVYLSYNLHYLKLGAVFILAALALWFYSTTYNKQLLVGNVVISLLVGSVPMLVLLFEFPLLVARYKLNILASGDTFNYLLVWVGSYAVFAFSVNFIREIIKDMEDFEGDYVFGRHTVPIVLGMKAARIIVVSCIILTLLPIFYLLYFHLSDKISFSYIVLFIIVPLIVLSFGVFWASSRKQFHFLSQVTKIIMLAGLIYCPIVNFFYHQAKYLGP